MKNRRTKQQMEEKLKTEQRSASETIDVSCGTCAVTRRQALIMAASASVLSLLPIFAASADTPDQWTSVGKPSDFVVGAPVRVELTPPTPPATTPPAPAPPAGAPPAPPVKEVLYVTRVDSTNLVAVSAKCTHRGCEVAWTAADNQFECPCHGAAFASNGKNNHGTDRDPTTSLPPLLSLPVRQGSATVEVNLAGITPDDLEPRHRRQSQTVAPAG